MMKKAVFLLLLFAGVGLTNQSFAQYTTGIGLRAGVTNGLTVKHFIGQEAALEGILHARWGGIMVTGLYEVHKDIRDVRGLSWFFGGGAHLGTWNSGSRNRPPWADPNESYSVFGLDGIIGLDYAFQDAPINLSLDWKPAINLGYYNYGWDEVALSIRFVF
ncbi:hypothetical protein [Fontibacter flavus]|uniref:Outer membrane protein beta-barrel domain-containing protein n=1 Tax=Fontibacter flavus TaxID=654838 RepID=A0ABV6FTT5_9BACT